MERIAALLDPDLGYSVLPGEYATCNPAVASMLANHCRNCGSGCFAF
jgi:hypothetical protein